MSHLYGHPQLHNNSGTHEYDEESLSVFEAADIWFSNGKDEEYMFGFSEDELEEGL